MLWCWSSKESCMAAGQPSPEEETFNRLIRALLESALDSLPQVYRTVLILRDVDGLNTTETAECLNLEPEIVETHLLHARAMLSRRLLDVVLRGAPEAFQFLGNR